MKKATFGSPFCFGWMQCRRLAVPGREGEGVSGGLCAGDHFAGMGQGLFGQVDAAEHARDLLDTAAFVQLAHSSGRGILAAPLVYEQVLVALCSHLRRWVTHST